MSKIVFIDRKKMQLYIILAAVIIMAGAYIGWQQSRPASAPPADEPQVIHLVTGEFRGTTDDGKTIESYVWNPGTVFVEKDRPVELRISGINGQTHPFVIEGLDISGEVQKGKTTIVRFTPTKEGIFRIICETHNHPANGGPMVGYLVVD
jgi:heme/copper-type cytochrome/quinol oxidase subunit 2